MNTVKAFATEAVSQPEKSAGKVCFIPNYILLEINHFSAEV